MSNTPQICGTEAFNQADSSCRLKTVYPRFGAFLTAHFLTIPFVESGKVKMLNADVVRTRYVFNTD